MERGSLGGAISKWKGPGRCDKRMEGNGYNQKRKKEKIDDHQKALQDDLQPHWG